MLKYAIAFGKVVTTLAVIALLVVFAYADELHNPQDPGFFAWVGFVGVLLAAVVGIPLVVFFHHKFLPPKRPF